MVRSAVLQSTEDTLHFMRHDVMNLSSLDALNAFLFSVHFIVWYLDFMISRIITVSSTQIYRNACNLDTGGYPA